MRWLVAGAAALVLAPSALAGGAKLTIPAPKVGEVKIEKISIKAASRPTIVATNLPALGHGFGAGVALGKSTTSPGTYVAYVVMFMGNLSTSPASTVNLQITGGTPTGAPTDETKNCKVVKPFSSALPGYSNLAVAGVYLFTFGVPGYVPKSPAKTMIRNDAQYLLGPDLCH